MINYINDQIGSKIQTNFLLVSCRLIEEIRLSVKFTILKN